MRGMTAESSSERLEQWPGRFFFFFFPLGKNTLKVF